jgi:hypothetical protein
MPKAVGSAAIKCEGYLASRSAPEGRASPFFWAAHIAQAAARGESGFVDRPGGSRLSAQPQSPQRRVIGFVNFR